jgi:hypothetical protein
MKMFVLKQIETENMRIRESVIEDRWGGGMEGIMTETSFLETMCRGNPDRRQGVCRRQENEWGGQSL